MACAPPLLRNALSGASSLACVRTSVKPAVAPPVTVTFRPLVNANGTSTPCTLCPSVRTYSTRYCVSVMELLGVGLSSTSFICSSKVAVPTSVKIEPVSLTTSDSTVASFCGPPVRLVITRYDEPCPVRTASLHEDTAAAAASAMSSLARPPHTALRRAFMFEVSACIASLSSENPGSDEDQQLAAGVGQRVALEQPLEDRHPVEIGRAIVRGLFLTDEDAADDRRRAVVDLDGGR